MSNFFISSAAIASPGRSAVMRLQAELARHQKELASGRIADAGLTLGAGVTETAALRQTQTLQSSLIATNALAASRLDASQAALSGMKETAQGVLEQLMAVRSAREGRPVIASVAKAALATLTSQLNTEIAGVHLFGGENPADPPLAAYSAPGSTARASVAAAFSAHFGFTQQDAAVSAIAADDMKVFLGGAFEQAFDESAWSAGWSRASSTIADQRISGEETIAIGASANEEPFRRLAAAYTMVFDLGADALDGDTFEAVLDAAITHVGRAIAGLGVVQSRLGTSQERIVAADERLEVAGNIVSSRLDRLERADPYEVTTALNEMMTRLEASYAATARIQQLSILSYL